MLNKKYIFVLLFFVFFSTGCLKSVEDLEEAQYALIQEKITSLPSGDCTCFVCTLSTGSAIKDFFTYNDLLSGGCHIRKNCNGYFLSTFIKENDKNFVRPFDIGMGNTFFEYEEANLRSAISLGLVLRELKERELPNSKKYLLPYYDGDFNTVVLPPHISTFDIRKPPYQRALEKNAIPIYYINSEHLTTEWLNNFYSMSYEINEKTSFIAIKSSAENVNDLVKILNTKCTDEEKITKEISTGKCLESITKEELICVLHDCEYYEVTECLRWETIKVDYIVYGCKSMVYIDEIVNASNVNYTNIFTELKNIDEENMKNVDSFLIHANITEEDYCHAPMVLVQAMNLSRTLLSKYDGKPSYLIVSIDENCISSDEEEYEIAQSLFYSIYYMRMTGIMGMIYYDYIPSSAMAHEYVEKPKTFLQLSNYYNDFNYGYNKEDLLFDSDGINMSYACDTRSTKKTLTIDMDDIQSISVDRLNPDPIKLSAKDDKGESSWYYVYAIPMFDYSGWTKIVHPNYPSESKTLCLDTPNYRDVHLDAEKCGVSNYLLLSFKKNGIEFNCDKWYNLIDGFIAEGKVKVNEVQVLGPIMRNIAFAYSMKGNADILTESEMGIYCYGYGEPGKEGYIAPIDITPCYVINDYEDIRNSYEIDNCYSYKIGIDGLN